MSDSTRYPFRLVDALAGQPVVTYEGEPIVGLVNEADATCYPLELAEPGAIFLCWTLEGTEYYSKESFNDLFMLHPPEQQTDATPAL